MQRDAIIEQTRFCWNSLQINMQTMNYRGKVTKRKGHIKRK